MRRALFVSVVGVIAAGFAACGTTTTVNVKADASVADGASPSDAGADACGSSARPPSACAWDASTYPEDAALGECRAKRAGLDCMWPSGVNGGCLSDDLMDCPEAGIPSVYTAGPAICCLNRCAPNEYAVGCSSLAANIPVGCRATAGPPSPGGPSGASYILYCCACP